MIARAEMTLTNEVGLHARPAAAFVKTASTFAADITITNGDRSADAKSMLGVLKLEATQGSTIVLEADGEDAQDAIDALITQLESAH
ncbi:HPr family phosphocarrier protein [Euzebya tangerina]|uniref:HPr family phosphocarrier protein n=1 Tax=Euzebya tangerina TaxID=591198 RepID=UPI000E31B48E|nr:HPr family phosphocarrier protein [Euzebya tangerina]